LAAVQFPQQSTRGIGDEKNLVAQLRYCEISANTTIVIDGTIPWP
jgi:hypothetical protein